MAWVKLDDAFFRDNKARAVGKDGRALYLAALCYAAANLTDGRIERSDLPLIAAEAEVNKKVVAKLVETGMWSVTESGWAIEKYLTFNPSAEKVRRDRAAAAERMQRARSGEQAPNGDGTSASPSSSPSRPSEGKSSSSDSGVPLRPVEEDERLRNCWAAIADIKLKQQRERGKTVAHEKRWLDEVAKNARDEHYERAVELIATFPDISSPQLAAALMGDTGQLRYLRRAS